MGHEDEVRAVYRAMLIARMRDAERRGDRVAQQRARLLLELHENGVPVPADEFAPEGKHAPAPQDRKALPPDPKR